MIVIELLWIFTAKSIFETQWVKLMGLVINYNIQEEEWGDSQGNEKLQNSPLSHAKAMPGKQQAAQGLYDLLHLTYCCMHFHWVYYGTVSKRQWEYTAMIIAIW